MDSIRIDTVSFVELWLGTVLYGVYLSLCVYIVRNYIIMGSSKIAPLLVSSLLMFILVSIHIGLGVTRFVLVTNAVPTTTNNSDCTNPPMILRHYVDWRLIAKGSTCLTAGLLADMILMYRCFIIWGRNRLVIGLPIVITVATPAVGYASMWALYVNNPAVLGLQLAVYALFLANTAQLTILIVYRFKTYSVVAAQYLGDTHTKKYDRATAIILESGAIYSVVLAITLSLLSRKPEVGSGMCDLLIEVIALVPTSIVVRAQLANQRTTKETQVTSLKFAANVAHNDKLGSPQGNRSRSGSEASTFESYEVQNQA